jgi:hypothetical protein
MFCKSDTRDRLVRALFDQHGLSILSIAMTPRELAPGNIIRTFPKEQRRPPCVDSAKELFEEGPMLQLKRTPFVPIPRIDSSDKVSTEIIAALAASLGSAKLDPAQVGAAFKMSGSENFQIHLSDSFRCDIREADLERALAGSKLTPFGARCRSGGQRFFVVTRTVVAKKARISGSADLTATVQTLSKMPAVLQGKLRANLSRKSNSTVEMERVDREMVIGFRALEIVEKDGGITLKGLDRPLQFRDQKLGTPAAPNDFDADGGAFIDLV